MATLQFNNISYADYLQLQALVVSRLRLLSLDEFKQRWITASEILDDPELSWEDRFKILLKTNEITEEVNREYAEMLQEDLDRENASDLRDAEIHAHRVSNTMAHKDKET